MGEHDRGQMAGMEPAHIHWPSPASSKKRHGSSFQGTQSSYQDEKCNLQLKQFTHHYLVGKQMHSDFMKVFGILKIKDFSWEKSELGLPYILLGVWGL